MQEFTDISLVSTDALVQSLPYVIRQKYVVDFTVYIDYHYYEDGVSLYVFKDKTQEMESLSIRFNGDFPKVTLNGQVMTEFWSLCKGFNTRSESDPFAIIYSGIFKSLLLERFDHNNRLACELENMSITMRQCYQDIKDVAIFAAQRCYEPYRKFALKFTPSIRLRIYYLLLSDKTERLAQLVESCPGALIFIVALNDKGRLSKKVAKQFIQDIVAGVKLNPALDKIITAWASLAPYYANRYISMACDPLTYPIQHRARIENSWIKLAEPWESLNKEDKAMRLAQRILIRRAKPRVYAEHLWLPPPLKFSPSDIPTKVMDNARWYKAMKQSSKLFMDNVPEQSRLRSALSDCLSTHYAQINNATRVNWLFTYFLYADITPNRQSDMASLAKKARKWRRDMRRIAWRSNIPLYTTFPVCLEPFLTDDILIFPLRNYADLIEESLTMQSCIASRVNDVLAAKQTYLHALVGEEKLTISVSFSENNAFVEGVSGQKNTSVSAQALALIDDWAEKNNITSYSVMKERWRNEYYDPPDEFCISDEQPRSFMQALTEHYGTVNVSNYPFCIRNLLKSYKTLSFRRERKYGERAWRECRVVLAIDKDPLLEPYKNTIAGSKVDAHYDHIIYNDKNQVADLVRKFHQSMYKKTLGPRGQFIFLSKEHEQFMLEALCRWFPKNQVYWLVD